MSRDPADRIAERIRAESCTDHRVPLALPMPGGKIEMGMSINEYFARKHARGECGTYYPLHQIRQSFEVKRGR